jgi:methylated-DNA-[protein]-cysteine S-methyltransferase
MHKPTPQIYYTKVQSRFGYLFVIWATHDQTPTIHRVVLPSPARTAIDRVAIEFPGSEEKTSPAVHETGEAIRAFLGGSNITFPLDTVSIDLYSPFQQAVLRAEHEIPRGMVSTYGRIARYLGQPSAARAVGRALATNPFPIIIPCHRAIRSDRTLGGYQGGVAMKRKLLEMEGISFDGTGRIAGATYCY